MLKILGVIAYISTGLAICGAYDVLGRMGEDKDATTLTLAVVLWPSFPIADVLGRAGVGHAQ